MIQKLDKRSTETLLELYNETLRCPNNYWAGIPGITMEVLEENIPFIYGKAVKFRISQFNIKDNKYNYLPKVDFLIIDNRIPSNQSMDLVGVFPCHYLVTEYDIDRELIWMDTTGWKHTSGFQNDTVHFANSWIRDLKLVIRVNVAA